MMAKTPQEEQDELRQKITSMFGEDNPISKFLTFLVGLLFGDGSKDNAPNESPEDNAPQTFESKVQTLSAVMQSGALTAWSKYQLDHKGEAVKFVSPVNGDAAVTSGFGLRERPTAGASTNHKGVDIGAHGKTPEILAAAPGIVLASGPLHGFGNAVIIGLADGKTVIYGHLNGKVMPQVGVAVAQGDIIGQMGNTGISTGAHLHFEVRDGDKAITPVINGLAAVKGEQLHGQSDNQYAYQKLPVSDVTGAPSHNLAIVKPKTSIGKA